MITWFAHPDGVHIWHNGQKVDVIPFDQFPALILACARELQNARQSPCIPALQTLPLA